MVNSNQVDQNVFRDPFLFLVNDKTAILAYHVTYADDEDDVEHRIC